MTLSAKTIAADDEFTMWHSNSKCIIYLFIFGTKQMYQFNKYEIFAK